MKIDRKILEQEEYGFLRDNARLGAKIAYLTVSGSIAYGTEDECSDLDIRGFAVEDTDSLLVGKPFEQTEDQKTDTVIYGLRKFAKLCTECNPNAIEMLGTREEHVLFMNDAGKFVRDHAELFLSKRAYRTFAGYATAQLRRLQNALARDSYPEEEKERHIRKSIESMMLGCKSDYGLRGDEVSFEILPSEQEDRETEIHISIHADRVPLRRFLACDEFGSPNAPPELREAQPPQPEKGRSASPEACHAPDPALSYGD